MIRFIRFTRLFWVDVCVRLIAKLDIVEAAREKIKLELTCINGLDIISLREGGVAYFLILHRPRVR
jgi:hypothetical protein